MKQIEIELEVYKAIVAEMTSFNDTPNDVLRRKFGIWKPHAPIITEPNNPLKYEVRFEYKGRMFNAQMIDKSIIYNGKTFKSPSRASIEITGTSRNGWNDWEYYDVISSKWQSINNLRK